jgi:6-phosphogluconolactonase (cycloisomerase 2 family)
MNSQAVDMRMRVILGIVSLAFLGGCGGGTGRSLNNQPLSPTPAIAMISPVTAVYGGAAFTLTVNGTNFVAASVVIFNGTSCTTTFVSATQLTAAIPAAALASGPGSVAVTVTNPAGGGTSNAVSFTIGPTFSFSFSVAVASDPTDKFGRFAYVTNSSLNSVSMYTINPTTGALQRIGAVSAGTTPFSVAVASGKFVYAVNEDSNDVSMYAINLTTGALEPLGTVSAGTTPKSVAVDPSGKFAYVANAGSMDVSMYTINVMSGTLTPIGTVAAGRNANSVAVHPSGKFAYVANGYPDSVSMYAIDTTTGALTSVGAVPTGSPKSSLTVEIAIDPSGNFAYAAGDGCALDSYPGNVSTYMIDTTTGALTSVGSPVVTDSCTDSVAVDPSGKFVYVTNNEGNNVSMYSINSTTGALMSIGTIAAGSVPSTIAIDPSGKFAYVGNSGSNDVSIYSINATTGALTLIGMADI